jgi:hypothetical protein
MGIEMGAGEKGRRMEKGAWGRRDQDEQFSRMEKTAGWRREQDEQ